MLQWHWKLLVSVLLFCFCLPIIYHGVYNILSDILAARGILSPVLVTGHYAKAYSAETLYQLSNNEDINRYESFPDYIARILAKDSDEYKKMGKIDMQIKSLSLSLRFKYDYDTLYKRYEAYLSNADYKSAMSDLDALLKFTVDSVKE